LVIIIIINIFVKRHRQSYRGAENFSYLLSDFANHRVVVRFRRLCVSVNVTYDVGAVMMMIMMMMMMMIKRDGLCGIHDMYA